MKLMISMSYRYANMLNRCVRRTIRVCEMHFFSSKKLPQKTVNGILTISTTCYIRHMCLFRSILFPNKSTKYDFHCKHQQNTMSSLQNPPWRQLPPCAKDVRARSKMDTPIRPARKHCFFIKITISQYHDNDISYIDIDIGKNAFSMTTLLLGTLHV